jgi:hypothetical protein
LSIGDSEAEKCAAQSLKETFPEVIVKMVKFVEHPSASMLIKELDALLQHIWTISSRDGPVEAVFSLPAKVQEETVMDAVMERETMRAVAPRALEISA